MNRPKRSLVAETAEKLRNLVFAAAPDSLIGSLQDLARSLQVGIVTLQQAARVLEHEGLLEVRRGPGGGYYGTRPDAAALERSIAAYIRANPAAYEEALNITSLLFNELVAEAAKCHDGGLRQELAVLLAAVDACLTDEDCGRFESDLQDLLFRMVDWPLFKLLTLVTLHVEVSEPGRLLSGRIEFIAEWKAGRRRIITAILSGDAELARFEADRGNRRTIVRLLEDREVPAPPHEYSPRTEPRPA